MIAIIDYGVGNLRSVEKALQFVGGEAKITSDRAEIFNANGVVLPGVGAFEEAMDKMRESELLEVVKSVIEDDRPFLGICLGMQMLFDYSEEGNECAKGLGVFRGSIKRFPQDMGLKIPHMGWNTIKLDEKNRLFKGINNNEYFYFVHSYYLHSSDRELVAARAEYGLKFDVAISKGNLFATQFHPEKSGEAGLKLLRNFIDIV